MQTCSSFILSNESPPRPHHLIFLSSLHSTFSLDLMDDNLETVAGQGRDRALSVSGTGSFNNGPSSTGGGEGVPGIGITIVILKTTEMFCSISDVKIKVMPQG